jgi:hypothetical protein
METSICKSRHRVARFLCVCAAAVSGCAAAQPVQPGKVAPPEVAAQLQDAPALVVGAVSVRPVRQGPAARASDPGAATLRPLSADTQGNTTYVARTRDNMVGISTNDLVVLYADTARVVAAAAGAVVSARAYPESGMVVLHVAEFDQLGPLHEAMARQFPAARFDLPVTYFPRKPK